MSPENQEIRAIRRRWSRDGGMGNDRSAEDYTDAGCRILAEHAFADIASLLARIAAVEAELDHARADAESHRQGADQWYRRAVSARARIAAVEALHFTRGRNILGKPVCAECSPLQPMPCPTLRALAASPTPTAAEKYAPCRDCGHDSADHRNDEPRPCKKRCRCVSFESPLPGQEKP